MSRFHDEFFRAKGPKHDKLILKCVSTRGQERIFETVDANKIAYDAAAFDWKRWGESPGILYPHYETEVICKSRGYRSEFILGYADIVFGIYYKECPSNHDDPIVQILVEAKPELSDAGSVLRQLKTYEEQLKSTHRFFKIITTYTTPDDDLLEYLEHEGVKVVVFEEDK